MDFEGRILTPTISTLCGSTNYCYWNGEQRYVPPNYAGFVFSDKELFARRIYNDYPNGLPEVTVYGGAYRHGEGCVIGGSGFGWLKNKYGSPYRFPHIGNVWFGRNVDLGSNVTIDRAGVGTTMIANDVKIDNGVHVGHNAYVGPRSLLTAHCIIGGSAYIGADCWIGLGAIIKEHVRVGDGVIIGMGAIVLEDVPSGETWVGNPAHRLEK